MVLIICKDYRYSIHCSNYEDAIIDKHKRLNKITSPRLVFCGGSNLAFGIDSKRIQDSIGIPVVNLGLNAGLGLEYIINEIKFSAKSSDIVIFSIEYLLSPEGSYGLKKLTASNFPEANQYFNNNVFNDMKDFVYKDMQSNLKNNLSIFNTNNTNSDFDNSDSVYLRKSFNKYGDVVGHFNKKSPIELGSRQKLTYRKWEGIILLNKFVKYAKTKNIKVYFLFPNYSKTEFDTNKEVIGKLESDLHEELLIPIINNPIDFVFSDIYFYNTVYHLNKLGRDKRTTLLIDILKRHNIKK